MTTTKGDGGPAFPVDGGPTAPDSYGMSLLDYFAAAVAAGTVSGSGLMPPEDLARYAYDVADAMLAERERRTT